MRILIIAVFLYYDSIVVDGEVQSWKRIYDGKIFQQNDNNTTNKYRSSFRHQYDDRDQSIVQQSSTTIDVEENRRLDTTQVNHIVFPLIPCMICKCADFMITYLFFFLFLVFVLGNCE